MHSDLCQKPRAGPTSCGMGVSDYWLDGQDDLNSAFVSLCLVLRMFVIVILIDSCLAFFVFHSVVYCFVLLVPVTWFTVIGWLYRSSPKWPMTYNVSSEWVVKACYILCYKLAAVSRRPCFHVAAVNIEYGSRAVGGSMHLLTVCSWGTSRPTNCDILWQTVHHAPF